MLNFIHFYFLLLHCSILSNLSSSRQERVYFVPHKKSLFDIEPLNFCHCSMFTLPLHAMMDTLWTAHNSAMTMQTDCVFTTHMGYYVVGDEVKFIHVHSIAFVRFGFEELNLHCRATSVKSPLRIRIGNPWTREYFFGFLSRSFQ